MDFVIPLHRMNPLFRATIEAISLLYSPRQVYIITPLCEIEKIDWNRWDIGNTSIKCIAEESFFSPISMTDLEIMYKKKDEKSREFGWWFQQILKMGAVRQISGISDPYMVWDSDVIPIVRWEIYPTEECPYHRFAILQKESRSEWNEQQYEESIWELVQMKAISPIEGTFVPHHFIMYKSVLEGLITRIENISGKPWFMAILSLSFTFWRFSEYKCLATYMNEIYPELLHYHTFDKYGNGFRFRDSIDILKEIILLVPPEHTVPYSIILEYVRTKWEDCPTYIQLEHL